MVLDKQKLDKEQGQALVEFALTLPILLLLTFGIIDLARLMFAYTHAIDAARQGIRYGIVTGLESGQRQFLDCQGIEDAALALPGLLNPNETTVTVFYEHPDDATSTDIPCTDSLTAWDVGHGDVLAVRVEGSITPLTPVLMMFADTIPFSYTSRRTIVNQGAAYTEEWQDPPPAAANFTATVDCSNTYNNVSFAWSAMSPIPDRAEIRNSLTGEVVVELNDTAPGLINNAYCNDCTHIDTADGFGMYYLVAYSGHPPSEMAGPPSTDAVVMCDGSGNNDPNNNGNVTISGLIFEDKDGNGVRKASEKGIADVTVFLRDAGPDGTLGTSDDVQRQTETNNKGEFEFAGLSVPAGLSLQAFKVDVHDGDAQLGLMDETTFKDPLTVYLADGQTYPGAIFGYN